MKSLLNKRILAFKSISTPKALFSSKVTKQLPMRDLGLKEHDPELYKYVEQEKFR